MINFPFVLFSLINIAIILIPALIALAALSRSDHLTRSEKFLLVFLTIMFPLLGAIITLTWLTLSVSSKPKRKRKREDVDAVHAGTAAEDRLSYHTDYANQDPDFEPLDHTASSDAASERHQRTGHP